MAQEVDLLHTPMPDGFAALAGELQTESLADGIGQGYAVIGYKGKNWTIRHEGESHSFVRQVKDEDGNVETVPMNYIDVIILRSPPNKSKSYYPSKEEGGGYDPESSDGKRPACSSLDGINPDDDVPNKQADLCAVCPRNVWHTLPNGKKGQDCTDYKRLAVVVLPALAKRVMGKQFQEAAFLRVPPASLSGLAKYGETLKAMGRHYSSVITRISFDPDEPHPKFSYKYQEPLTNKDAPFVLQLRESAIARRITGEDSHTGAVARLAQTQRPAITHKPAAVEEPVETGFTEQVAEPAPVAAKPKAKAKAPKVISKEPVDEEAVETGFQVLDGGNTASEITQAGLPSNSKPAPAAVTAATEDTGDVVEADDELEKEINELIAKKSKK